MEDDDPNADRAIPKVISPADPCAAWTAKANKRVQFGYGLNYLIDIENAVIVDVDGFAAWQSCWRANGAAGGLDRPGRTKIPRHWREPGTTRN